MAENQKNLRYFGKRIGTIDINNSINVKVGRQYSSAGYSPNRSCFHLAVSTEKHATFGSKSKHSLNDFVFQCPPHAQGKKSEKITIMKYKESKVNNPLNQFENKFCFTQPITPTSVNGGGDGGISFCLTYAILVIHLPTIWNDRLK